MLLNTLIFICGSVLLLSTGMALILWFGYRHHLIKHLVFFWISGILSYVAQGIFNNLQLSGFFAFSINWLTIIYLLKIFSEGTSIKLPYKLYHFTLLFGLLLTVALFSYGTSFQLSVSVFCVACVIPIFHGAFKDFRNPNNNLISHGYRVLLIFAGLHFLDYPFVRPNVDLAVVGFSITLILFFCFAIYVPVFILQIISNDYASGLQREVENRTHQLVESNNQLKLAFEELKDKNILLEDLSKENQSLLSILVHDISNPMQILFLNYSMLFSNPARFMEQINQKSERIKLAIDSVTQIIQEARSFHAARLGVKETSLEEISPEAIVRDLIGVFEEKLKEKRLSLEVDFESLRNNRVMANAAWLKNQVLSNLISNAIKFSNPGGSIQIRAEMTEEETVLIFVQDHGVGIAPAMKDKLFELGELASSKGTVGEAGTGLGLPIVKQYTQLMGGHIRLLERPTAGTCFEVELKKAS
jgi:signal transduction histidine kinase